MVLAEDVIRRRLEPFRADWRIQYFEGRGQIKRPDIFDLAFSLKEFLKICKHNLGILQLFISRALRYLRK